MGGREGGLLLPIHDPAPLVNQTPPPVIADERAPGEVPIVAYISYSWDSEAHKGDVLAFSNRLRGDGIETRLDRYVVSPAQGWAQWQRQQVQEADFVLLVCTQEYKRRIEGVVDSGVYKDGQFMQEVLNRRSDLRHKFIPVCFAPYWANRQSVPDFIGDVTYYDINDAIGYEALYGRLTGQNAIVPPPVAPRRRLRSGTVDATGAPSARAASANPQRGLRQQQASTDSTAQGASLAALRAPMTGMLNREEIGVLWFDLFGTVMADDLPGRSLPECVIELLARAEKRGKIDALVGALARDYSWVLIP